MESSSPLDLGRENPGSGRPGRALLVHWAIRKFGDLPALHASGDLRRRVDSTEFEGKVAADFLEALPPEQLNLAADAVRRAVCGLNDTVYLRANHAPGDAEAWIRF